MSDVGIDLRDARILIVDDVPASLDALRQALEASGYRILVAPNGGLALEIAAHRTPDLILLDVMLPDMDGFEVCRRLKEEEGTRNIPVLFLTAQQESRGVLEGFAAGGLDYIVKPFQKEEVLVRIRTHLERARLLGALVEKNRALEEEIGRRQALSRRLSQFSHQEAERWGIAGFVAESRRLQSILEEIELLQDAHKVSVLISGESGTGKELVARAIHFGGPRREEPFVPVNCSAIPRELADSLFFGHVKGAFTGADGDRDGYFALAEGGTLFLDEIGDMPTELQPKLLRVLEDGRFRPLGARREREADVRVIAASNSDLQEKGFRRDLYFRLAQFSVAMPPLRRRREDIQPLALHFLQLFAQEMNLEPPTLSGGVLEELQEYDYPGNVRELKNIVEGALIRSRGNDIEVEHLELGRDGFPQTEEMPVGALSRAELEGLSTSLDQALEQAEKFVIQRALEQSGNSVAGAARLLGTYRNRIYRALDKGEGE
jgi:DNA-binding NtrC family response regulator